MRNESTFLDRSGSAVMHFLTASSTSMDRQHVLDNMTCVDMHNASFVQRSVATHTVNLLLMNTKGRSLEAARPSKTPSF